MSSRSTSPLLGAAALGGAVVVLSVTVAVGLSLKPPAPGLRDSADQRVIPERSLTFVENHGQVDPRVTHYARGSDSSVFFTPGGLTFALDGWALKLDFVDADPRAEGIGRERAGSVNYLTGARGSWLAGVPAYAALAYEDLWPGIDLAFDGDGGRLKYEFVVAPGADPSSVLIRYRGATSRVLDAAGALHVVTPGGTLVDAAPVAYQQASHGRVPVRASYRLEDSGLVGLQIGPYDPALPLVIDPEVLVYGTFLGGGQEDSVFGIAVDRSGNFYVTGDTRSKETFPITPGAFDEDYGASTDAFVTKFTADGSGLVYSTFLGGEQYDSASDVAVDASGNAYVAGFTSSLDFPITPNAFDKEGEQDGDGFLVVLDATGSSLAYGSFIGGGQHDSARDVALTSAAAYITGITSSDNFPVTPGAHDTTFQGETDAFVARVDPAAADTLVYSTLLGGKNDDEGAGVGVDAAGRASVTGTTGSPDFPTTSGAFDETDNPLVDAFVARMEADGSDLVFSTYLGGAAEDHGYDLSLDADGDLYVTGFTASANFPVTPNAFDDTYNGEVDAFVTKLFASGAALDYSTFLGGAGDADSGQAVAVDRRGRATVVGVTWSDDFPVTDDAFQSESRGYGDAFVTTVRAGGGGLVASTYLGSTFWEFGNDVAVDRRGLVYAAGETSHPSFPITPDAYDPEYSGGQHDGWVAKLDPTA